MKKTLLYIQGLIGVIFLLTATAHFFQYEYFKEFLSYQTSIGDPTKIYKYGNEAEYLFLSNFEHGLWYAFCYLFAGIACLFFSLRFLKDKKGVAISLLASLITGYLAMLVVPSDIQVKTYFFVVLLTTTVVQFILYKKATFNTYFYTTIFSLVLCIPNYYYAMSLGKQSHIAFLEKQAEANEISSVSNFCSNAYALGKDIQNIKCFMTSEKALSPMEVSYLLARKGEYLALSRLVQRIPAMIKENPNQSVQIMDAFIALYNIHTVNVTKPDWVSRNQSKEVKIIGNPNKKDFVFQDKYSNQAQFLKYNRDELKNLQAIRDVLAGHGNLSSLTLIQVPYDSHYQYIPVSNKLYTLLLNNDVKQSDFSWTQWNELEAKQPDSIFKK